MIRERQRRRSRRLSADEHTLWQTATRAVRPLKPAMAEDSALPPSAVFPEPPPRRTAETPGAPAAPAPGKPGPPPLAPLERRLRQRLAKGHAPIDRRLDLHGRTQREAHDALARFLRSAQAEGATIVLVVTGKGMRGAAADPFAGRGVLRRLVPQWLNAPEFRRLVVGFEPAHIGHGGEGALYVRVRRARAAR